MQKAILLLALALPGAAQAEDFYYQSTMPDGRLVIGDKPAPGAKDVKKIPLRAGNVAAPLASPAQKAEQAAAQQQQQQALDSADNAVKQAQQELDAAKAALEAAREPQPGERLGTVTKGKSRLSDAYFERIKKFEDAVAAAQNRLDDALARRNAAR